MLHSPTLPMMHRATYPDGRIDPTLTLQFVTRSSGTVERIHKIVAQSHRSLGPAHPSSFSCSGHELPFRGGIDLTNHDPAEHGGIVHHAEPSGVVIGRFLIRTPEPQRVRTRRTSQPRPWLARRFAGPGQAPAGPWPPDRAPAARRDPHAE